MMEKILPFGLMFVFLTVCSAMAQKDESEQSIHRLGDMVVTTQKIPPEIKLSPHETLIRPDESTTATPAKNVADLVLKLPIFDTRSATDLVPDVDNLYMRGFSSNRFTTAIDGMPLRKTGGRKASNIVDYGLLPPWLFDRIEVLSGPHSPLYPGKSIGGVMNLIPKEPKACASLLPETHVTLSASSYGTQNHNIATKGAYKRITYDLGYQMIRTDGYLRHTEAAMDTMFARLGYLTPSNGWITLSVSHTDTDKDTLVINDHSDTQSDYDSHFPVVTDTTFYAFQKPTWNSTADSYRINLKQPSPMGLWQAQAYYSEEKRDYYNETWVDGSDHSLGTTEAGSSFLTQWTQHGGRLQNTLHVSNQHELILGSDLEQCYDDGNTLDHKKNKRLEITGVFIQDLWHIYPRLSLKTGLRYEDVSVAVSNLSKNGSHYISGKDDFIHRNWSTLMPKSYLTWTLDNLTPLFRDTTVSVGASRIWRAPDYHGDYNPQGRPAGAYLKPEHGLGCDVIVTRRLFSDIMVKVNYAYDVIENYIAKNRDFAAFTPSASNVVDPGSEYMDYKINLDKVIVQSVECLVSGHLVDDLTFFLGYAFLDMQSKGGEPAGKKECDRRARHRINGNLSYDLFDLTRLIVDITYQDEQIIEEYNDVTDTYREIPMNSWHRMDLAVRQILFEDVGLMKQGSIKVFVKNVLDEEYLNSAGYPATDRTWGASINLIF